MLESDIKIEETFASRRIWDISIKNKGVFGQQDGKALKSFQDQTRRNIFQDKTADYCAAARVQRPKGRSCLN